MHRFFIDLTNGHGTMVDEEGQIFASPFDASREALRVLAEIALDEQVESDQLSLSVNVRTADGEIFYEGKLSLTGRWIAASL